MESKNFFKGNSPLKVLSLPFAFILMFIIILLPTPEGLTIEGQRCLAVFACLIIMFMCEPVNPGITAILSVPLMVLMGACSIGTALYGFSQTVGFRIMGTFILSIAMTQSGLADRFALWIMDHIGSTTRKLSLSVVVSNFILTFALPSALARMGVIFPIILVFLEKYRENRKDKVGVVNKFSCNILLTATMTAATMTCGCYTAANNNILTVGYIETFTGQTISYFEWMLMGLPPAIIITGITWLIIMAMFKPEFDDIPGGGEYIKQRRKDMGKLKINEWRTAAWLCFAILFWVFGDRFGIDSSVISLLAAVLLTLPVTGFLTWKDWQTKIPWQMILIVGFGMSLGQIMDSTGASIWLGTIIFDGLNLGSVSFIFALLMLCLLIGIIHISFVGTTTMLAAFAPILYGIITAGGWNVIQTFLACAVIILGFPCIMFYCTSSSIMCYSTGQIDAGAFTKVGIPITIVGSLIIWLCAVVYWPMLSIF